MKNYKKEFGQKIIGWNGLISRAARKVSRGLLKISLVHNIFLWIWVSKTKYLLRSNFTSENFYKVLYVDALSDPYARVNSQGIQKAFEKVSVVEAFDYRGLAKVLGTDLMNELLYLKAILYKPHLIFLGKSESVVGYTIRRIKEHINTCVIHWYGDYRPTPQPWVVDIGRHADYTFFQNRDKSYWQKYHKMGVTRIGFWPMGTDPDVFHPQDNIKCYDVVFMANNADFLEGHQRRRDLIDAIIKNGIDLHLFGEKWEYLSDTPHVYLHPFVYTKGFGKACSIAKIIIDFDVVSDIYLYTSWRRVMNSMACKAFFLTSYFPGLEEFFENGKHLVWFDSIPEAIELIKYYLVNEEEREKIATMGQQEVVAQNTWDHRINKIFTYIKDPVLANLNH